MNPSLAIFFALEDHRKSKVLNYTPAHAGV
jgi:hypothetical protein